MISFTRPVSGSSVFLSSLLASISAGAVSVNATANGTAGSYDVMAGARGAPTPVTFHLTNQLSGILLVIPGGSPSGACDTWGNACDLQYALTNSIYGSEIWVKAGKYTPTTGTDRSASFELMTGVAFYGGFAGTETSREQRDPMINPTILSGDIDNNDSQTPIITDLTTVTGNTTNSYHVVIGAEDASLDGFIITAGYADGSFGTNNDRGGGMYNKYSSPLLTSLTFIGNSAGLYGGGIYDEYSSPTLTKVTFSSNSSAANGGGMDNEYSNPTLVDVTFSGNSAVSWGGGMSGGTNSTLTNVTFSGNSAHFGGGWVNNSNPTLTNVTFSGNSAVYGGGMYHSTSSATLANVTFDGNSASVDGGGMYISNGAPTINNAIFWGNTAAGVGAQIYNFQSTVIQNDNVVQSGCPAGSNCTNIITADPLLGTLGNYGGFTQTVSLQDGSSAIDAGNDATCPADDQRGVIRPQNAHCDIGAFEVDYPPIVNSIIRTGASPTNYASVNFTVTFSEPMAGVNPSNFSLMTTGVSGATISGVSGSGSVYTVTASTGTGDGAVRLDVPTSSTITDLTGNLLDNIPFISGQMYTIDKTAPIVNTFVVTTYTNNLNIPITAFTASDGMGVTGYMITETSIAPAADASGWSGAAPSIYPVSGEGTYNLYPWARDAVGNVSATLGSPRTVIVDTHAPTVDIFTVTTPTNSLNIPITGFTASDAVGVTGYKITTSAAAPAAGAAGWSATAPSTYTVSTDGIYTLYPWARDAAGNVSTAFGTPRPVAVDTHAPSVNTFSATSPSRSLNIPITAFTASDDVSVTNYIITTSSIAPVIDAAGWSITAPTIYTVLTDGSYTLYPWVKDASGNISATFGSPASVTVITTYRIYLPLAFKPIPPPGNFNKSSPVNGATSQPANPTLNWGASSGASSYEYCYDTINNNACDTTWISTATNTSVLLSGLASSTSYYWQVRAKNNAGTSYADSGTWWAFTTALPPGEGIVNGNFESGSTGWTQYSTHGWPIIITSAELPVGISPHSGSRSAWLGGDLNDISYIQQQVTISSSAPYLVYWHWIASADICGNDFGRVLINGSVVDEYNLCSSANTYGWVSHSVNLSAYAGQSVTLQIRGQTNGSNNSNLIVDDVSLQASAAASGLINNDATNPETLNNQSKTRGNR